MISLPFSFICGAGPGGPGGPLTPCSPYQQHIQDSPLKTILTLRTNMTKTNNIKENYHLLLKIELIFFKSYFSKISQIKSYIHSYSRHNCIMGDRQTALKKDL